MYIGKYVHTHDDEKHRKIFDQFKHKSKACLNQWTQCPPLLQTRPLMCEHGAEWLQLSHSAPHCCCRRWHSIAIAYFPKIAAAALFKYESLLALSPQVTLKLLSFWLTCVKWILTLKTGMEVSHCLPRVLWWQKTLPFHNVLHFTLHQVGQRTDWWRHAVQPRGCCFHPGKVSECVRLFVRSRGAEDRPDGEERSLSYTSEWQRRCRAEWLMVVWVF